MSNDMHHDVEGIDVLGLHIDAILLRERQWAQQSSPSVRNDRRPSQEVSRASLKPHLLANCSRPSRSNSAIANSTAERSVRSAYEILRSR